ncbi:phytoene/squalene synthase family protein [Nocardia bhagyanarayanae]|uniref:Phytoene synthase n=1 Tax=Nocardia bhagyanarayanae TaxID=1215925 RepID=A0A543EWM6_9NOCA|nr:phytoene/squalene synthase family protein [Nocardia bhagyanarayanae]TQM25962.1 phytoene synthase [Nocardia bhagyanarayanae]
MSAARSESADWDLAGIGRGPLDTPRAPKTQTAARLDTSSDLSGTPDIRLADAYRACRAIAAEHGRTYFLATRLLSAQRRPAVHALYAFARMVDDIVDYAESSPENRHTLDHGPADELDLIEKQLRVAFEHGTPTEPVPPLRAKVLTALADTVDRYAIDPAHFWTFLDSMRMDVPGTPHFRARYATMAELREYMRGSAAAIGLQLLPVLGTVAPPAEAEPAAAALGEAFQLTNFLRDIGEDLDRGRVYLPADQLAAFGVDDDLLAHCRRTGRTDPRVRRALAHLIAINRGVYRIADPGIDLLNPRVRPAIRAASALYAGILDRIEDTGYAVFQGRAVVPTGRRLLVAGTELMAGAFSRR